MLVANHLWEHHLDCQRSAALGLIRDCHRCVITRFFDRKQALERMKADGDDARDDDGQLLTETTFDSLEVAQTDPAMR